MPARKGLIWQGGRSPHFPRLQWAVPPSQLALNCVTRHPVPLTLMFLWLKPGAEQAFFPNTYCVLGPSTCVTWLSSHVSPGGAGLFNLLGG